MAFTTAEGGGAAPDPCRAAESAAAFVDLLALALAAAILLHALCLSLRRRPSPGKSEGSGGADTPGRMDSNYRSAESPRRSRPASSGPEGPSSPATPSRLVSSLDCDECGRASLRWSELVECGKCRRDSCERCAAEWVDRSGSRFCSEECAASYIPTPERGWLAAGSSDTDGDSDAGEPPADEASCVREWARGS